jgi:hypothetical protein
MLLRNPVKDKVIEIVHLLDHSLVDVRSNKNLISRQMV